MKNQVSAATKLAAQKYELLKRVKTFAWTLLWVGVAAIADHALASLGILHLPTVEIAGMQLNTAVVAGLVLNQISKYARNKRTNPELQ